ncbi:prepilin-type N-terminal cleavage/methylation domain-containing protein [bacterium]|nr:prepilin-type N-terminal cleavage/methylation domain-containing protein [bacterium]
MAERLLILIRFMIKLISMRDSNNKSILGSPQNRNKRFFPAGFTLIEVLIGAFILVLLLSGVYKVFQGSTRLYLAGMWNTKAQNELRNTLTYLRDEIARASSFSTVSEVGLNVDPDPKFKLYFKKGISSKNYNGALLKFYQCRTAINLPSKTFAGAKVYCEVSKKGSKIVMKKEKTPDSGETNERLFSERVLLEDVSEVKIDKLPAASGEQLARALITILFTLSDPQQTGRTITEETKAKSDVEAVEL